VLNVIQIIKQKIDHYDEQHPEQPFRVYDRRWKKMVRLLRTAAFPKRTPGRGLDGRVFTAPLPLEPARTIEIAQETNGRNGAAARLHAGIEPNPRSKTRFASWKPIRRPRFAFRTHRWWTS
jgi:hypothetical protein